MKMKWFFVGLFTPKFFGFKLLYHLNVISFNTFLKTKNQEGLHADPRLGKRFLENFDVSKSKLEWVVLGCIILCTKDNYMSIVIRV